MSIIKTKEKVKKKIKKIDIIISISILILVITIMLLKIFVARSEKYISTYAINQTKNISENIIVQVVYDSNNINYENIIITNKNKEQEITDIDFNTKILNDYLYEISNNILLKLNNLEQGKVNHNYNNLEENLYYIPSGLIYNIPYITNIFPKIPFKIARVGNVETNIKTNIADYGINNSLIELNIIIKVEMKIVYPFITKNVQIDKEIPIIKKIIKGNIPSYYGGILSQNNNIQ